MSELSHVRALVTVARKELTASLRDRQTALYTLVLPICLYPVLLWLMVQGFLVVQGQKERTEVEVRVAGAGDALWPELARALGPLDALDAGEGPVLEPTAPRRWDGPIGEDEARAWLAGSPPGGPADDGPDAVLVLADAEPARLFYDSTRSRSQVARERVARRLPELAERLRASAAREAGVDPRTLEPLALRREDVAPPEDAGAVVLSSVLPLLLVVMAFLGAFFPAVDLTAGEKERRTAETTWILPVPRAAVHQGKILAVATTTVIATFLNLVALGLAANHLLGTLTSVADVQVELPLRSLVAVAPLALLFAFFTSAVLTGVAGLAATFKEGQALLGPVQMLFVLPALVGVTPGIELDLAWAWVPVVNVVLAFRALLLGKDLAPAYLATAAALALYAWIAIRVAVRLLSREDLALAGATVALRRVLAILRGPGAAR